MIPQCQIVPPGSAMVVWWVNGTENFPLFSYDPVANAYAAVSPGLETGRATVTAGPDTIFSIYVNDVLTPCLQGAGDGSVQAVTFSEYGGTAGGIQPQLQFFIGNRRVASLSAAVLKVNSITEAAPAAGNVFQIFANNALAGTISATGLVANQVKEN